MSVLLVPVPFLLLFAVLFGIGRLFVGARLAVRMALLMMACGIGVVTLGALASPKLGFPISSNDALTLAFYAILAVSVAAMTLVGVLFVHWSRRKSRPPPAIFD